MHLSISKGKRKLYVCINEVPEAHSMLKEMHFYISMSVRDRS